MYYSTITDIKEVENKTKITFDEIRLSNKSFSDWTFDKIQTDIKKNDKVCFIEKDDENISFVGSIGNRIKLFTRTFPTVPERNLIVATVQTLNKFAIKKTAYYGLYNLDEKLTEKAKWDVSKEGNFQHEDFNVIVSELNSLDDGIKQHAMVTFMFDKNENYKNELVVRNPDGKSVLDYINYGTDDDNPWTEHKKIYSYYCSGEPQFKEFIQFIMDNEKLSKEDLTHY